MIVMKDVLPMPQNTYGQLFRVQTAGYSKEEIEHALEVAGPVVVELLASR